MRVTMVVWDGRVIIYFLNSFWFVFVLKKIVQIENNNEKNWLQNHNYYYYCRPDNFLAKFGKSYVSGLRSIRTPTTLCIFIFSLRIVSSN